jgi:hypothetical protein
MGIALSVISECNCLTISQRLLHHCAVLLLQWHPDKHPDASAKAVAEVKFKEAKAAYEVLVQHASS